MSATPIVFDPEIEALLQRIAADPDSSLLRVTRPQAVKGLFERTERVSVGMTGLSSAERELVRVHRHEVAHLLREVCKWRMLTDEDIGDKFCPFDTEGTRLDEAAPTADGIVPGIGCADTRDGMELFSRCVAEGAATPSTSSLALAAYRLQPSASARIYIGLDLTMRDCPHSALRAYRAVLEESSDLFIRSIALSNSGMAYELLHKPREQFDCYRHSANASAHPLYALEWLFASLREGFRVEVVNAARAAETAADEHPSLLEWYARVLSNRRGKGLWSPSSEQRVFVRGIENTIPQACRRVVDAFA